MFSGFAPIAFNWPAIFSTAVSGPETYSFLFFIPAAKKLIFRAVKRPVNLIYLSGDCRKTFSKIKSSGLVAAWIKHIFQSPGEFFKSQAMLLYGVIPMPMAIKTKGTAGEMGNTKSPIGGEISTSSFLFRRVSFFLKLLLRPVILVVIASKSSDGDEDKVNQRLGPRPSVLS